MNQESAPTLIRALTRLVGRATIGIEFVEDYFQVVFDDARISVLSSARISQSGETFSTDTPEFRSTLASQSGVKLERAEATDEGIVLTFASGAQLTAVRDDSQVENFILDCGSIGSWVA